MFVSPDKYFVRRETSKESVFEENYWKVTIDPDGMERKRADERDRILEDVKNDLAYINALPPGRILDVGCGIGFFLSGINDDWEKHGVEISKFAGEQAKKWAEIFIGPLHDAKYESDSFDVVVLMHVLEHLEDPVSIIKEINRVMKPGGKIVLGTPDFDCHLARHFGEHFRMLHDQTHISLFSNESVFRLLRDHGFEVEHVDYPFFETRHFTKENLMRLFDNTEMSPPFPGNIMTFYAHKL